MKCFLEHLVRNQIVLKNLELNLAHNNCKGLFFLIIGPFLFLLKTIE